jgi:hypothetical protein
MAPLLSITPTYDLLHGCSQYVLADSFFTTDSESQEFCQSHARLPVQCTAGGRVMPLCNAEVPLLVITMLHAFWIPGSAQR